MTKTKAQRFSLAKKAFFAVRALSCALFAALLFNACDAGLGESIDTTAPTVSITSPDASAVLSGAVTISGACFDDKKIASVNVTIANALTEQKIGEYTATIEGNAWSVVVNQPENGTYPLSDGTYSASAVCHDAAGRQSGVASRVFEVDNTAPVFCITSPNSLNINDPAAFGRSVKIKGEIADDHPISSMDIRVFKADASGAVTEITSSMAKTSFSGFETAGGTEVKIAQYYPEDLAPAADSDDYPLYQNYNVMYSGAKVGDTVKFYIFPFLTDVAGNTSGDCYIQTQLKKLVSDACGVETTSDSLQTAQFKKMINGSYSLNELDVAKVKQILNGSYVQTSTSYKYWAHMSKTDAAAQQGNALLAMSVNANNSPMYEFGGYAVDASKTSLTEASPNGQISVKISAGLDGTLVKPSSLNVYLWECDDTLTLLNGADLKNPDTASYSSAKGDFTIYDGTNPVSALTQSVATGNYNFALPGGLVGGTHYLLTASGNDDDNNELFSDSRYAFMVTISANAPSVDFDGQFFVNASKIKSGSTDAYSAEFTIEDKTQKAMTTSDKSYVQVIPVLYKDYYAAKTMLPASAAWTGEPIKVSNTEIVDASSGNGTYKATVPLNIFDLTTYSASNYTIALKVMAKNDVASSEATTYIFWADNAKPALEITSPVNNAVITESNPDYSAADGKFTARGTWSDINGSGTKTLEYSVDNGTTWLSVAGVSQTASQTNWSASIAVTQAQGQSIWFRATDAAGNVSDVKKVTGITYDFGVPTVALTSEPSGSASNVVQQYYSKDSGTFDFTITAQDGLKMADLTIVATIEKTGKPPVTVDNAEAKERFGYSEITDTTNGTDKKIIKTVKIAADPSGGKGDGVWTITATATDAAGRKTTQMLVSTTIDCVKPVFANYNANTTLAFGKNADGLISAWYKDNTLTVWGKAEEATSGLSAVYYWLQYPGRTDSVPTDLTATNDGLVTIGGTTGVGEDAVAYKIMPDKFAQSDSSKTPENNTLYVQAVDLAGNKSAVVSYDIKEDQTPPSVSAAWYTYDNGATMTQAAGSVMTNGSIDLTLYGAVSDNLSGLNSLVFKIGDAAVAQGSSGVTILYSTAVCSTADEYKNATYSALSGLDATAVKSWKAVIAKGAISSGDLYVTASDTAGNSSEQKAFALVLDTTPPSIALTSPTTILASATSGTPSAINGSVNFKGTANDDSGLASVAVYYSPDNTTSSTWTLLDNITDSSMYNWSVSKDITTQNGDSFTMLGYTNPYAGSAKPLYIKLVASDKAKNDKVVIYKYSIDPDGDRPKITITNVALADMTSDVPAWRTGTSDIYGSVYDDDDTTNLVLKYKKNGDTTWTTLPLTGTSFTITGLADGPHTLQFQVTDGAGTVFTSNSAASYISPKLYGKNQGADSGAFESGDTQLYVKIDTVAPTTSNKAFYRYSKTGAAYGDALASLGTVGGDASKFKYKVNAKDTNGIKSVSVNIKVSDTVTISKSATTPTEAIDGEAGYDGYEVADIDISAVPTGTYTAEIVVEDKAGLKKTDTLQIAVDNTAPEVTINSPAEGKKVLGTSATVYGGANEFGTVTEGGETRSTIYYAVSPIGKSATVTTLPQSFSSYDYYDENGQVKSKTISTVSAGDAGKNYGYKLFKDASVTWTVNFDGDIDATNGTHAYKFNEYLASYGIASKADIDGCVFDSIVKMYVWIKAVDAVGNVTEVCRALDVDPQGDRPEIRFGYPESSGTTVGGTVNLNGDVTDPANSNPVEKDTVWVQIISDKVTGHGTYTYTTGSATDPTNFTVTAADVKAWVSYAKSDGTKLYNVYKMKSYVIGGSNTSLNDTTAASVTDDTAKDYGILASFGGTNWSLEINSASEFNNDESTNQIAVRAYAYNGKLSVPALRAMKFDADAPEMSDRYLKMSDGSIRAYTDNIYIRDKNQAGATASWNMTFKLNDQDKINKIGFSNTSAADAKTNAADATSSSYCIPTTVGDYSDVTISYPLNSLNGADGKETLYVYYEDAKTQNPGSGHYTFTVNHDNKSPVLTTSGTDYKISADVCNKDGWYTFGSKAEEGSQESGFARVVVYFMRAASNKVFDPMYSKGYAGNYTTIPATITSASAIQSMEGLYWKKQTVTASLENGATNLTVTADPNIHTGGLVKILGVNYRIKSASGTTVALDSDIGVTGSVTAYFALGNVVDNAIKEKEPDAADKKTDAGYGYGYGSGSPAHDNDDGDLMVESAVTTGTQTIWEALINSKNIPDGPIDICYTVYDAAGNYATGSVTNADDGAFVSNNAPRIANVTVGTDYNGNDTIDEGESKKWFATSKASWENALKEITIQGEQDGDPYLTAKGKTIIRPEILGGNGALYYYYSYPAAASSTNYVTGYNKTVFMKGGDSEGHTDADLARELQEASVSADITMQVGDLMKAWKGTGKYEFKIYDSTEGLVGVADLTTTVTTPTSQYATITLYMDNQVNDTTAPTGEIQRFYWKGINDNSIYGSESASDAKDLLGHIELEGELPAANFDQTSGEYDKDPKVSGKIVIRGEAFDAVRLDSLYITLPGFTGLTGLVDSGLTGSNSAKFYKVATFDPASGWKDSDDETTPITVDANGWRFNVESSKFDASGHSVTWKLELDTNKYSATAPAATDVLIEFMSKDKGVPTCDSGTKYTSVDGTTKYAATQFKAGKPSSYAGDASYQIDIVPYITKVYTNLAKANSSNWSVYNRTASGAYLVYTYLNSASSSGGTMTAGDSEVVQVYGFNLTGLKHGSTDLVFVANPNDDTNKRQDKNAAYDCYEFAAGALTGTGSQEVDFSVDGIYTLNNKNNNDGKGGYAGAPSATPSTQEDLEKEYSVYANYYNRLPNDSNNNRLNDDVKFDVWQLNDSAAVPISNKIVDPVMKINPKSGKLGFAFENDPTYFSMPNGVPNTTDGERSYDFWTGCFDKMTVPCFDYISGNTDRDGEVVALAQGNDISATNADNFTFYYSKWGTSDASKQPSGSSEQLNGLGLEQIGYATGGKNYWDKSRFQGTSVVTANKHVYLAYYDRVTSQIRFRSSLKNDIPDDRDETKTKFGNIKSRNDLGSGHGVPGLSMPVANAQVFAAASCTMSAVATTYKPSQHLCLAAKAGAGTSGDDLVAIVWYDGTDCYYSVNTTPGTDRSPDGNGRQLNKFDGTTGWSDATKVFSNAGQYCKVAFDYNGGVHIAAYDAENTCVRYAYSASATSPSFKACVVDAKEGGGSYLTLDVALEGGVPVPQIGYYSSSCAKPVLAKYAGPALSADTTTAAKIAGAIGKYMTGAWEVSAVPSTSVISKDRVNVALRKTAAGVITTPATGTSYYSNTAAGYGSDSYGVVYGLGNTNAVMGYCRAKGAKTYIETAQRK